MALWLVRAGRYGEREDLVLQNKVALIGWQELPDLRSLPTRKDLAELLQSTYPDLKPKTLLNWESQIWPFVHEIRIDDIIAIPLKHRAVILFGEVSGEYRYDPTFPLDARHVRSVKSWKEITRNQFSQDLLYSFGSAMTVCRIQRNNAEERVRAILAGKPEKPFSSPVHPDSDGETTAPFDIEQFSRDQISQYINQKFKGHGLARLVGAILQAQGYQIRVAPEGPDGGVDVIAGKGPLGFETPRLAVQVKSSDSPVDVGVLRELSGVMSTFGADHGLIVAWGGYKGTVEKEAARQFFKIRLWDADDLVVTVQENYEQLSPDIQAEIPLKRIWALVQEEE